MANRYTYQFNASYKPKMAQIEGFVSIGTGGLPNFPDAYPVFPSATGPTGLAGQTGVPRGLMPGQATAGVPTGWVGSFSGTVGLYGAGVKSVSRVATGAYVIQLDDDYVRLDAVDINVLSGVSGAGPSGAFDWALVDHTVGFGNSIATGGVTGYLGPGINPKNRLFIQFVNSVSSVATDLPLSAGFFLDIRLRDSMAGSQ
jgi:hypothetical protein